MARLGFCTDLCDKLGILHTQSSPKAGQLHGRFHVRFQQEQNLWNECARLIANAVVHYNSVILSEVLQTLEKASSKAASQALKRISPLAWQRVNFYGRYRFDNDLMSINMVDLTAQLVGLNAKLWQNRA